MINKTTGKIAVMNTLKSSADGVNSVISVSSINQSNDKNASDPDPTMLAGVKVSITDSGNFRLNDNDTAISCKQFVNIRMSIEYWFSFFFLITVMINVVRKAKATAVTIITLIAFTAGCGHLDQVYADTR